MYDVSPEDVADGLGFRRIHDQLAICNIVAQRRTPPIHMPFCFEAAILSRMRSPVTSRSNWAKESSTLSVSRPIEVVVLNCCVTETNDTPLASKASTILAKSLSERVKPVDLVDDDRVDPPGVDIGEQALEGRAFQRAARDAAVIVHLRQGHPAGALLAENIGVTGLALGIQRVELLLEPLLGGLAGVDGAADSWSTGLSRSAGDFTMSRLRLSRFLDPWTLPP